MNFESKNIMLVVAHPDDELLGCGATMHKIIKENNCKIHVVILGEGITSRDNHRNLEKRKEELEVHKSNILKAQQTIGYQSLTTYDFPDNRFDAVALLDIIKVIEKEKESFKPEIVFTHHGGDLNVDHQLAFEAVMTACRPMKNESVKTIITFETPSSTEWVAPTYPRYFMPNMFVEISKDNLKAKINGMESYEFEKRAFPHPRSPEALETLAKRWGTVVGCEYAEAFCMVRKLIK